MLAAKNKKHTIANTAIARELAGGAGPFMAVPSVDDVDWHHNWKGVGSVWWVVWLIAAVALGVAEAFTLTLVFGIFSAAALLAAVVAGFDAPWVFQVLTFAAASAAGLLVVRPIARRHALRPPLTRDGTDALIGKTATVLEAISAEHGLIRLSGEDWTARPLDDQLVIPAGAAVDVMEIHGATAIVYPRELLP